VFLTLCIVDFTAMKVSKFSSHLHWEVWYNFYPNCKISSNLATLFFSLPISSAFGALVFRQPENAEKNVWGKKNDWKPTKMEAEIGANGLTIRYQSMGSMLWSQYSAIFAHFLRKNWRFSQKPMLCMIKCLQKLVVVWAKNSKKFRQFFRRKYF
jgi:hypothetical protein